MRRILIGNNRRDQRWYIEERSVGAGVPVLDSDASAGWLRASSTADDHLLQLAYSQ